MLEALVCRRGGCEHGGGGAYGGGIDLEAGDCRYSLVRSTIESHEVPGNHNRIGLFYAGRHLCHYGSGGLLTYQDVVITPFQGAYQVKVLTGKGYLVPKLGRTGLAERREYRPLEEELPGSGYVDGAAAPNGLDGGLRIGGGNILGGNRKFNLRG